MNIDGEVSASKKKKHPNREASHSKPAENVATPNKTQDLKRYGITRGAAYFTKGGNR